MHEDLKHLNSYVSKFKLLTAEEELESSKKIEAAEKACWEAVLADEIVAAELQGKSVEELMEADILKEVLHASINTSSSVGVKKVARTWLAARNRLVDHNLRLALHTASRYFNKKTSFADLFQEACTGLIVAAERFDWKRGLRFSTIATYWIRHYINTSLSNTSRTIRIPSQVRKDQASLHALSNKYLTKNGSSPSIEELAAISGIEKERVSHVLNCNLGITLSLDAKMFTPADSDSCLYDVIPCDSYAKPDYRLEQEDLQAMLERYLRRLSPREEAIIRQRFALADTEDEHTLETVGTSVNVCRERARQLQNESLHKLKKYMLKDKVAF